MVSANRIIKAGTVWLCMPAFNFQASAITVMSSLSPVSQALQDRTMKPTWVPNISNTMPTNSFTAISARNHSKFIIVVEATRSLIVSKTSTTIPSSTRIDAAAAVIPFTPIATAIVAKANEVPDPAEGAFPGGTPTPGVDVPVTIVFLILFILGAGTHISIYRANSRRGHKFLLSDLMFDFCMVRNVTCIMRIIWAFVSPRGVILAALIFENGGYVKLSIRFLAIYRC
jgi:hypothetical protein